MNAVIQKNTEEKQTTLQANMKTMSKQNGMILSVKTGFGYIIKDMMKRLKRGGDPLFRTLSLWRKQVALKT